MHPAAAAEYPGLDRIYLDTASYGLPPAATVAVLRAALDSWAAGSADWVADWDGAGDRCRELVAPMLGAPAAEVSLQPAVSVAAAIAVTSLRPGGEIVAPRDEFASVLLPALAAAEQRGATVRRVEFGALADSLSERTALVVSSHVRSNDGRVQDLAALGAAAARAGARVLVDATHSAGILPVDAARHGIHYVVAAAYKHLLCPRGVAFLRVAPGEFAQTLPIAGSWRAAREPYGYFYGPELSDLAPTAARYDVAPGDHTVREFASSGTPIPPAPDRPVRTTTPSPRRRSGGTQRASTASGTPRASTARGAAPTGRNPSAHRPARHGGAGQNSGRNSGSGIR